MTDKNKEPIIGANVIVTHEPSGTRYGACTNADGRYFIQGMRAGGLYRVKVSCVGMKTDKLAVSRFGWGKFSGIMLK